MLYELKYFFQRVFRGWDDRETWDLEYEFLKWIFPRLKRFAKISIAYPPRFTEEEWDNFLNQLLKRVENIILNYKRLDDMTIEEQEEFMKEKTKVVQLVSDNLNDFGW